MRAAHLGGGLQFAYKKEVRLLHADGGLTTSFLNTQNL